MGDRVNPTAVANALSSVASWNLSRHAGMEEGKHLWDNRVNMLSKEGMDDFG